MSTLTTERLILRPFRKSEAEMMHRNRTSDENVTKLRILKKLPSNLNTVGQ